MDEFTQNKIRKQMLDAVEIRQGTTVPRMLQDLPPLDVHVCLGPGRCMFPRQGADSRVCPFCLAYPQGRGTCMDVNTIAYKFIKGN